MTKARAVVLVSFLVAFAAGAAVGVLASRPPAHRPRPWPPMEPGLPPGQESWLTTELGLTREQQEQMRQIWSRVARAGMEEQRDKGAALRQERERAIQALLTDEQKARYEQVLAEYARKLEELSEERRKLFQEAVESTKQMLTPAQRQKYEEVLARREPQGRRRHRGGEEMAEPAGPGAPPGPPPQP